MKPATPAAPGNQELMNVGAAIRWLAGVFLLSVVLVLVLLEFFSHLQEELHQRGLNEQARLFIGEEIVRGIYDIEKDFYRMTMTNNPGGMKRIRGIIDKHTEKLLHDMTVLKEGGTVRRETPLNLEGVDDILREVTYRPQQQKKEFVLEQIEIVPLLDQMNDKTGELQALLEQRWTHQESGNRESFFRIEEKLSLFLKQLPPYFERLEENANRLFYEGDKELRELETQLQTQRQRLKLVEIGLIGIVVIFAGIVGVLFLRRINYANQRLGTALDDAIAARNEINSLREQNTAILNTLSDGIYATDMEGRVTFMNASAENILGWREEELNGVTIHSAVHHTRPSGAPFPNQECPLLDVLLNVSPLAGEEHFIARDGRFIPVSYRAIPLFQHNQLVGSLVSFQDISRRQQSEALIRLQKAALDAAANMIAITARNGLIEYVNRAFSEVTGYAPEEVIGKHSRILKSGRHDDTFYENMWNILLSGKAWEGELINRRKDGGLYPEQMTITPIIEDNEITHFIAIKRDISQEAVTRTRLKLIETAIRNIDQGLLITDTDFGAEGTTILYTNPGFSRITGYEPREVLGRRTALLNGPQTDLTLLAGMGEALAQGRSFSGETVYRHKDGTPYDVELQCSPVRDDKDQITHYIGLISDIGPRKRAEETMRRARDQALETSRLKSEFLSTMSHEIRTPMNGIIGMTDLLLDTPLDTEQREFTGIVRDSAHSLLMIINDILDFSKVEAGKMEIEITDFSPANILEGVSELLSAKAREKKLSLATFIDPALPRLLRADPTRLRQVLLNLLGNAIKFTEHGEVQARVLSDETHRMIRFEIHDTGIGMSPQTQARLFQSFTQADSSTTRKYGGTGLGLAISKRLVELMGGDIGVTSEAGKGSIFWFTLPLLAAYADPDAELGETAQKNPAPQTPAALATSPAIQEALKNRRLILLAEDNPTNQKVAQLQLTKLGYTVHIVNNGVEAVEAAEVLPYAAILMDCQMPVMDGFEATAIIRKAEQGDGAHIPIIAMTANAMQGDRERCLAAGMDDYVSKPVSPEKLASALSNWVNKPVAVEPPPAPKHTHGQLIDLARITDFIGDEPELIADLLDVFLNSTTILLDKLRAAVERGDAPESKGLAHQAKGACANLGVDTMAEIAAELEKTAAAQDWPRSRELCKELDAIFAKVGDAIQAIKSKSGGAS